MKYKCIIFDCDGVLVDSEELSNRTLIEMAETVGVKITMAYAETHFVGAALKDVLQRIASMAPRKLPDTFEQTFRERSFAAFKADLKPIKGIHALLDKINIPYCVASSGPSEKIKLNLTTTKLISKFENRIFSCYDIGLWKPNPAIFIHAATTMGFKPQDCVVIEDSLPGIQAAKNGGFDVFAFANKKNKNSFEQEGANVFFEMNNLYDLLTND